MALTWITMLVSCLFDSDSEKKILLYHIHFSTQMQTFGVSQIHER